jgi:hypothetical protein
MAKKDKQAEAIAALKAEVAAQRAEVEALKAAQVKAAAPPEPFKEKPFQRYDPTAGMCMPPSALAAMIAAEPKGFMHDVALRDNRAPTGRPGMIPNSQQSGGGSGPSPSSTPGWVDPKPLGPPPGIHWVDAQLIADDVKQRGKGKL